MEENKIVETIDSKLSDYKESFESQKNSLSETFDKKVEEAKKSFEEQVSNIEKQSSLFEEGMNDVVDVLKSFKERLESLEQNVSSMFESYSKQASYDDDEEETEKDYKKKKKKQLKKLAKELGYSVSKESNEAPKPSTNKENFIGNEGEGEVSQKKSFTEFVNSKEFEELIKNS